MDLLVGGSQIAKLNLSNLIEPHQSNNKQTKGELAVPIPLTYGRRDLERKQMILAGNGGSGLICNIVPQYIIIIRDLLP